MRCYRNILLIIIQRPCYQWGSPCQDLAGNWTTQRPPYDRKQMQTAVVWSCFPFIRSGKTILQSTVRGGRRQGRQRKWWEDNIREWTGLEFGKSQRAVRTGKKWRRLVAKSSLVPQQPSRLRDWWWWWWWWWWWYRYIGCCCSSFGTRNECPASTDTCSEWSTEEIPYPTMKDHPNKKPPLFL